MHLENPGKNIIVRFQTVVLFLCFPVLMVSCLADATSLEPIPTLSLDEIVVQTLAAHASELAQMPQPEVVEALGEEFSIEVTQDTLAATPIVVSSIPEKVEAQAEQGSAAAAIPDSHYIWNIWGHRQYFPIGCEASVADDWAWYFGVEINEFNFQMELPLSDNPDKGFVGSVDGPWGQVPPYAYGVHAVPVAQVLRENYGMHAQAAKSFTIEQIKEEIASDQPVIAWVIGNCVGGIPYEFTDQQGDVVLVAAYEHVVIITGYDEETLRYMNNGKFYDIQYQYFENSWSVLGNMVVYLAD